MSTKVTPQSDSNLDVTITESGNLICLDINPASFSAGSGTVTNVATGTGLTGGPITTTGTIAIDTTSDITFNSVTADMYGVSKFTAKNVEGDQINKGQPVFIYGHSGSIPEVREADSAVTSEMPAFGIASEDITNNTQGNIATAGDLIGIDTTGTAEGETWAVGDTLYVGASALTNVRPTDEAHKVQSVAKVIRVHATVGQLFLSGAGRYNDVPNLDTKHVFIGDGNGYEERQLTYTDILNTPSLASYITADSTDTLTNKSGAISQWTNDAGYITSQTDNQTLSFADPVLTISGSLSTVDLTALTTTSLPFSSITSTPTTIGGYGITDAATQTTISNNALNSVITGSAFADLLNGNSDFTWNGTNGVISGTTGGLTTPILKLATDTSSWNAPQLMCSDSNGDVFSQVGQLSTGQSKYQWNITLDPNNTHGRSGVTTGAGEYFVAFEKNYSDQADIRMDMQVYGAHQGFNINVRDDGNSYGGNQYKGRPLNLNALETNINCGLNRDTLALTVTETSINCEVPIGQAQLASDPASPANGWTYYNTTTDKLRLYAAGAWVDLN